MRDANSWKLVKRVIFVAVGCGLVSLSACSNSPGGRRPSSTAKPIASRQAAAEMAATLANQQCEKKYQKRPFRADQHPAILEAGTYRWGGLDVGGPDGLSALVTFREDGSEPHVEVYFSSDRLTVPKSPPIAPPKGPRL